MAEILRRPEAEADLDDLWLYIARDNPDAADRFIDRIEEVCNLLANNSMMGRSRPELAPNLRSFPVGSYIIFYRPTDRGVEILRVIRGGRDVEELF